jgi:phosphogluconate dehydratase
MALHPTIAAVTDGIIKRSGPVRARYLQLMDEQSDRGVTRSTMSCGNFAHGLAASEGDKPAIRGNRAINIGIVSAYNDMLSAQAPDGRYPEQMKLFAREVGATAPVAGGVPATGDADTQGLAGVELSLFSRDTIVRSTAVALCPGMFEAKALLGNRDPAAIQVSPEALGGGPLARVRDGDLRVSADTVNSTRWWIRRNGRRAIQPLPPPPPRARDASCSPCSAVVPMKRKKGRLPCSPPWRS